MATSQYDIYAAASKANNVEKSPEEERAQKLKTDWNTYVNWLAQKGLKGHPSLDSGVGDSNVGIQQVKQFQKENPGTLISPETISEVQSHFQNYREYVLNKLRTDPKHNMITDPKTGEQRSALPDENLDFFMRDLSKVDGIPGQKTTNWQFPSAFLTTIYKGPGGNVENKVKTNLGLAK